MLRKKEENVNPFWLISTNGEYKIINIYVNIFDFHKEGWIRGTKRPRATLIVPKNCQQNSKICFCKGQNCFRIFCCQSAKKFHKMANEQWRWWCYK